MFTLIRYCEHRHCFHSTVGLAKKTIFNLIATFKLLQYLSLHYAVVICQSRYSKFCSDTKAHENHKDKNKQSSFVQRVSFQGRSTRSLAILPHDNKVLCGSIHTY